MSSELTAGLLSEYSEPTDLPQTKMLSEQLNAPANEVPTTVLVTSVSTSENHNDTDIEEEKNKSINNGPGYPTTELNEIPKIVAELRKNFYQENPTSYNYRVTQLKNLLKLMQENSDELCKVCQSYFGGFERKFYLNRFFTLESEIASMANNLSSYMKGSKCKMPIAFFANWKANVIPVARGVVAIIAPWNFPIWLLIKPLIGAIAAGNAIVIKPSEITGDVAILLTKLITKYLDNKMIRIVNGGVPETTKLLEEKFDYIFFTGGVFVFAFGFFCLKVLNDGCLVWKRLFFCVYLYFVQGYWDSCCCLFVLLFFFVSVFSFRITICWQNSNESSK